MCFGVQCVVFLLDCLCLAESVHTLLHVWHVLPGQCFRFSYFIAEFSCLWYKKLVLAIGNILNLFFKQEIYKYITPHN